RPASSQQVPAFIKAKHIEVVDDAGRRRILLGASGFGGEAEIEVFDGAGATRFSILVNAASAMLVVGRQPIETPDAPQIILQTAETFPNGSSWSGISMKGGTAGRDKITFGVLPDLGPKITIMDQGRAVFSAP